MNVLNKNSSIREWLQLLLFVFLFAFITFYFIFASFNTHFRAPEPNQELAFDPQMFGMLH